MQSAWLASHDAIAQADAQHLAVPLAATQSAPQLLQLLTSLARLTSQPSDGSPLQSPKPAGQLLTPHLPMLHHGVPFPALQIFPHAPQLLTSLSVRFSQPFER